MDNKTSPPSFIGLYVAAGVLATVGWAGMLALILNTVPAVRPRWLFFLLGLAAITGSVVPFVHYLNRRFGHGAAASNVLLRRAIWVGVLGATLAWLQIGRTLGWGTGVLLASVFAAIEWLIELREHSRWDPGTADEQ